MEDKEPKTYEEEKEENLLPNNEEEDDKNEIEIQMNKEEDKKEEKKELKKSINQDNDNKKYYSNYKAYIGELTNLEKDIQNQLTDYKSKANAGNQTINDENKIKKSFSTFEEKLNNLQTAYHNRNAPSGFPSSTLDQRQKQLQQFRINFDNMRRQYNDIENKKYLYKDKITEDYMQKEEYKGYGTGELMTLQKKKLQEQDDHLEEIALDVKKNTVLATNVGHVIKDQNKQLDEINEDMDEAQERMKTLTGRFKNYAKRQSWCCLVWILILEFAIALAAYYFLVIN